ncbi:T9SS type A sorting domain-containing protein [Pontibacter anaerobius]|uniref:T9SS type A sorting domain-containing protein n=1 Tax=Pontibacter anaerobius TaxID=2993940 RepID=A0ABT3RE69_9BACT|nr:T9SS type A sorting domain-containing protein [Pontibacter anaerobius]MCX2739845.1 T9SS type A sorting domain-containing protein [Pontibacter anaerobius]
MKKQLALILFILGCAAAEGTAQAVLQPLQQELRQPQKYKPAAKQLRQAAEQSLPFFDDFAQADTLVTTRWNGRGVFINNRYARAPITINVATFDGLDANGRAYATNSLAAGPSDTLTSETILLGGLTPADSVYLSFYWQSGGLGDVPDQTESNLRYLALEFQDNTGAWQEVWRQAAVGEVTDFAQVFVGLKEARFFHSGFRFRFRNVGLRNGMADVWNVDYVELDKNRRKGQNTTRDIGISQSISRLLKNYTAMPARQFRENPEAELAEEVRATLNNLGDFPGAISWRGYMRNAGATAADTFLREQALIPGLARQYEISGTPSLENINLPASDSFALVHGIRLDTKEQNAQQRANDVTERSTAFADYYALDDGTAEAGFSFLGTGNTQVAQRFDLNLTDQVRAFRVYFPRVGNDISGTSLTFRIWENDNGVPGKTLHQQSFQVQYSDSLNGFYEVELTQPVRVQGSFYIGWTQPGSRYVNIGFDKNENATGRRFTYTASGGWAEETSLEGAIMMRPVMVGEEPLGVEDDLYSAAMLVFPNPSRGEVYLSEPFELVQVYDALGRQVFSQKYKKNLQPLELGHLSPGVYTLRIQNRKAVITKKIILTKL